MVMPGTYSFMSALNSAPVEEDQDFDIAALNDLDATSFLDSVDTDDLDFLADPDAYNFSEDAEIFSTISANLETLALPAPVSTALPAPVSTALPAFVCTPPHTPLSTDLPAPVSTPPPAPVSTALPAPVSTPPTSSVPQLYWPTRQICVDDDKLMEKYLKALSSRPSEAEKSRMSPEARAKHRGWAAKKRARVRYGRKHAYPNKVSAAQNRHREDGKFETTERRIERLIGIRTSRLLRSDKRDLD
jgi:hypothetical protein